MEKSITVKVDESTYRWLSAFASVQGKDENTTKSRRATPAKLLAQAAFCMADYAGRRDGSWESDVAKQLLYASGFQGTLPFKKRERLTAWEDHRNAAYRKK